MPRGHHPILLILNLALPTAAGALGLGDIHVDSALNEPLSAQIEIVGASLDDLTDLRAAIANLETFQRYGADRPTFLNSATFKIGEDSQGRPVLNIRSRDAFTDPLVRFLVDLKWRNSELVREYSLLLDPAGLSASRRAADIAAVEKSTVNSSQAAKQPAASTTTDVTTPAFIAPPPPAIITAAPAVIATRSGIIVPAHALESGLRHRIETRDTLRAIVRHAGARTEDQARRMMIATLRANPGAFDGNINFLHRGAVLEMPTSADIDAISPADARHDVDQQMLAWRTKGRYGVARRTPAQAAVPAPAAAAQSAYEAAADPSDAALASRLQSLEQQLGDLHQQMATEHTNIQDLKRAATRAQAPTPAQPALDSDRDVLAGERAEAAATSPSAAHPAHEIKNLNTLLGLAALLLGVVLAGYGYLRKRLRRPARIETPPAETGASAALREAGDAQRNAAAPLEAPLTAAAESRPVPAPTPRATPAQPGIAAHWLLDSGTDPYPGMGIDVDTEALERSYLESPGFNSAFGKHAATSAAAGAATTDSAAATAELEMSEVEETEVEETENDGTAVNTAVIKVDATTLVLPVAAAAAAPDTAATTSTDLDFNLSNLDATVEHVQMPSALHDRVEVSERRTNIVDVLKLAIDRDPHRQDLRMKLVETYYNAAAGNRRAFMEVVRKLARERDCLSAEEWNKIVRMGREIVPDDILFADLATDEDDVAA